MSAIVCAPPATSCVWYPVYIQDILWFIDAGTIVINFISAYWQFQASTVATSHISISQITGYQNMNIPYKVTVQCGECLWQVRTKMTSAHPLHPNTLHSTSCWCSHSSCSGVPGSKSVPTGQSPVVGRGLVIGACPAGVWYYIRMYGQIICAVY